MKDKAQKKTFSRRLLIMTGAKLILATTVVTRLYDLQINENSQYQALSDENKFSLRLNVPQRGRISDRHGLLLAENSKSFQVSFIPENSSGLAEFLQNLQHIQPMSAEFLQDLEHRIRNSPSFKPIVIFEKVGEATYHQLMLNYHKLPGLEIDEIPNRLYRYAFRFSHLTGYVGKPSKKDIADDAYNRRLSKHQRFSVGREGLEKSLNKRLRGIPGIDRLEIDAHGRTLHSKNLHPAESGEDLHLTVSVGLQSFIYNLLNEHRAASAVVIDINDGGILAMVNVPSYDCNRLVSGISTSEWQNLVRNKLSPLRNRACQSGYPPGSVFKPMVALAALREGYSPLHFCRGRIEIGSYTFRCWKKGGHGTMDMTSALRESCDVWFYNTARHLGIEAIASEARLFGLDEAHTLPLPGVFAGLIGDPQWKKRTHNEAWYLGDSLVAAIGQGYVLNSPLQLAVMMARLGRGDMALRPYLVMSDKPDKQTIPPLPYPLPDNLAKVQQALWQVVNARSGTAYKSRLQSKEFQMAGKTGTSQIRSLTDAERDRIKENKTQVPWELRDHALFTAFAPYNNPRYALAVVVEHGQGGSKTAAPIAQKIMHYLQETHEKIAT